MSLPALLHPPCANAWWWLDGALLWTGEGHLFAERRDRIVAVPLAEPVAVWRTAEGWLATGGGAAVARADTAGVAVERDRRTLHGVDQILGRPAGGPWGGPGLSLPMAARRTPTLQVFPRGHGAAWISDGFVYRVTAGHRPEVVTAAKAARVGPDGGLLLGDDAGFSRGAAPGHPVRELDRDVTDPVRWREDGAAVMALAEGDAVGVSLATGRVERIAQRAIPAAADAFVTHAGVLEEGGRVVRRTLREATWAAQGTLLAGPGGLIWDLAAGRSGGAEPVVQLGATAFAGERVITAHWESGRGHTVDARTGRVVSDFQIPLVDGDVLLDAAQRDGAAVLRTALGDAWKVTADGGVERCDDVPPPPPAPAPGPAFPLVEADLQIGGVRWGWRTDGLLVAWEA